MVYHTYKPALALSPHVELMWRRAHSGMPPSWQRAYPNGGMALVIHVKKPTATYFVDGQVHRIRVPLLAGPYSRSFHFDPSECTAVIGVLFRPGAARVFFPVAAHELHNTDIALHDLYPDEADCLLNELCSAPGEGAQFRIVEEYLARKLKNGAPIPDAVRYAVRELCGAGGLRSIREIQLATGLSHTKFIQVFREYVGMTPKLFARVRRFRTLVERIEKGLPVSWAALAADSGYFDQAHLIHEFRAFAGITPLEFSSAAPNLRHQLAANEKS